jgi:hypothetical protein
VEGCVSRLVGGSRYGRMGVAEDMMHLEALRCADWLPAYRWPNVQISGFYIDGKIPYCVLSTEPLYLIIPKYSVLARADVQYQR